MTSQGTELLKNTEPTLTQLLSNVRDVLVRGWTTGRSAIDKNGDPIEIGSPDAVCWCLIGATVKACGNGHNYSRVTVALREALGNSMPLAHFNDTQESVQPVLELIDKAIANERSMEVPVG